MKYKVWWIPQVPMEPFEVEFIADNPVPNALLLLDALAKYDAFQYENNIKPDYANAGGLVVWEDGEWVDWHDDDGEDIDAYLKELYAVRDIIHDQEKRIAKLENDITSKWGIVTE